MSIAGLRVIHVIYIDEDANPLLTNAENKVLIVHITASTFDAESGHI